MKFKNLVLSPRSLLAAIAFVAVCHPSQAADHGELSSLGLESHWEGNIGGAPLANGFHSFVIWPHSTKKREYVTVSNGTRVIERIHGDEVDLKAIEDAILKGEKLPKPPTIGLEGATSKAEKLVATYKKLGKNVDLEPYSQRLVYAISLTSNGILKALDAETGAVVWSAEVGNSNLPMFGPGVSDDFVAVTNGNVLYVYELESGTLVTTRTLAYTPTSSPSVLLGKAIVPSIDGRLVSYDIKSQLIAPAILRSGSENRLGTTISADHQFLAWPSGDRLLMARMEKIGMDAVAKKSTVAPKLWASASINERILSSVIATQSGFLTVTVNGTVMHSSTAREGSLLWKSRLAVPVTQSPIANKEMAFVVSDDGYLFALRLADGAAAWGHQPGNVKNLIAIGNRCVYIKDTRNTLAAFDLATGLEVTRANSILPNVIPNSVSDRLFFVTNKGQVKCLREIGATLPTFSTDLSGPVVTSTPEMEKAEEKPKTPESESNPFGDGGDAPDPFATDPN